MKKLLLSLLTIVSLGLTGCSQNNQVGNGNQSYTHIHVQIGDKVMHDEVISYAYDWDGTVVEANTKTYGWIMLSNGFLLYNSDKCPLCNK